MGCHTSGLLSWLRRHSFRGFHLILLITVVLTPQSGKPCEICPSWKSIHPNNVLRDQQNDHRVSPMNSMALLWDESGGGLCASVHCTRTERPWRFLGSTCRSNDWDPSRGLCSSENNCKTWTQYKSNSEVLSEQKQTVSREECELAWRRDDGEPKRSVLICPDFSLRLSEFHVVHTVEVGVQTWKKPAAFLVWEARKVKPRNCEHWKERGEVYKGKAREGIPTFCVSIFLTDCWTMYHGTDKPSPDAKTASASITDFPASRTVRKYILFFISSLVFVILL